MNIELVQGDCLERMKDHQLEIAELKKEIKAMRESAKSDKV